MDFKELKKQHKETFRGIYREALYNNGDVNALADQTIALGVPSFMNEYAANVPGAPIDKLADAVIALGDVEQIILFGIDVYGAPVDKIVDAVIKLGTPKDLAICARSITGAPKEKIFNEVYQSKDIEAMSDLATRANIPARHVEMLVDGIIESKENVSNDEYLHMLFEIAIYNSEAPIDKITDEIAKSGSSFKIYQYAKTVKNANSEKLASTFVKSLNKEYAGKDMNDQEVYMEYIMQIISYIREVRNAPIIDLMAVVTDTLLKQQALQQEKEEFDNEKE